MKEHILVIAAVLGAILFVAAVQEVADALGAYAVRLAQEESCSATYSNDPRGLRRCYQAIDSGF